MKSKLEMLKNLSAEFLLLRYSTTAVVECFVNRMLTHRARANSDKHLNTLT